MGVQLAEGEGDHDDGVKVAKLKQLTKLKANEALIDAPAV